MLESTHIYAGRPKKREFGISLECAFDPADIDNDEWDSRVAQSWARSKADGHLELVVTTSRGI